MNRLHGLYAALALVSGLLAAWVGTPTPSVAPDEIDAFALAERIHARRVNLVLVDVRAEQAQEAGTLPGALKLATVTAEQIRAADFVIAVGDGAVPTATADALRQRWQRPDLLRLHGGIAAWNREVLYPVIRADASQRQRDQFEQRAALSRYFGGQPRVLDPDEASTASRSRQGC